MSSYDILRDRKDESTAKALVRMAASSFALDFKVVYSLLILIVTIYLLVTKLFKLDGMMSIGFTGISFLVIYGNLIQDPLNIRAFPQETKADLLKEIKTTMSALVSAPIVTQPFREEKTPLDHKDKPNRHRILCKQLTKEELTKKAPRQHPMENILTPTKLEKPINKSPALT